MGHRRAEAATMHARTLMRAAHMPSEEESGSRGGDPRKGRGAGPTRRRGLSNEIDKSSEPRQNLSGSWQQGHSAAYNTPFLIQVVCK